MRIARVRSLLAVALIVPNLAIVPSGNLLSALAAAGSAKPATGTRVTRALESPEVSAFTSDSSSVGSSSWRAAGRLGTFMRVMLDGRAACLEATQNVADHLRTRDDDARLVLREAPQTDRASQT